MADIQTYLDEIQSAVYGKDVRQSIHDGMKAMNEEIKNSEAGVLNERVETIENDLFNLQLAADGKSYENIGEAHAVNNSMIQENKKKIEELEQSGGTSGGTSEESEQLTEDYVTYSPEWVSGKIDSSTGELTETTEYEETTEFIELPVGSTITASGTPVDVYFYDVDTQEYLSQSRDMSDGDVFNVTEMKLVRITAGANATVFIKVATFKTRVETLESDVKDLNSSVGNLNSTVIPTIKGDIENIQESALPVLASKLLKTLYSNNSGASTGTMTDTAANYTMLIVVYEASYQNHLIYGSMVVCDTTSTTYDSRPAVDSGTGNISSNIVGISFSGNTFNTSLDTEITDGTNSTYVDSGSAKVKRIFGFKS